MREKDYQIWLRFAVLHLFFAGGIGIFLRWLPLTEFSFNYSFFLHGHSHIALLGWINTAILGLILRNRNVNITTPIRVCMFLLQVTLFGMLIFFPIQGYAAATITFSSAFLILNYFLLYFIQKGAPGDKSDVFRIGFFFFVLSSLGPWMLGPLVAAGFGGTPLYFNAIYTYLHFLINGWFVFGLLSASNEIRVSRKTAYLLALSILLLLPESYLWSHDNPYFRLVSFFGAALQLSIVGSHVNLQRTWYSRARGIRRMVILVILVSIWLKCLLNLGLALPFDFLSVSGIRPIVIGYLHLVLIGVFSIPLLLQLVETDNLRTGIGWIALVIGFVITEVLLFSWWPPLAWMRASNYLEALFAAGCLLYGGFIFTGWAVFSSRSTTNINAESDIYHV